MENGRNGGLGQRAVLRVEEDYERNVADATTQNLQLLAGLVLEITKKWKYATTYHVKVGPPNHKKNPDCVQMKGWRIDDI